MSRNLFFSVGEPSGDQHAARLIAQIRRMDPTIRIRGFGGPRMRSAGCSIDRDMTQHAVVGLLEVVPKLRQFSKWVAEAESIFKQGQTTAVVLVDFPGFNWNIAKQAKRHGIPVYYYCPPQLWAWGGWRVRKMRRLVDHVLAVLPMEQEYFSRHGISSTYVGHPFFDAVEETQLDARVMDRLGTMSRQGEQLIAVLPGSRDHEVHRSWPLMLQAIRRLHSLHPKARFLVACYRDSQCLWCSSQLSGEDQSLPIEFFVDRTSEIVEASHSAMMVSGSVSLELMARLTPAVVIYRVGRLLHFVGKRLIHLDSITLPNLMGDRRVFPELVSTGATHESVEFLVESIDALLRDEFYYRQTVTSLAQLNARYAKPGASLRAAKWICRTIGAEKQPRSFDLEVRAEAA
jgi:lipid-A-disaccharide synthase